MAAHIRVEGLTLAYGQRVILRELNFAVASAQIFIIMGGSGCGKSTLLKSMVGLLEPSAGSVYFRERDFTQAPEAERQAMRRQFGILYQGGALWGSLTLAENLALPMEQYTELSKADIRELASFKLSLVGLKGFEDYYPAELSGGMKKRAALARAMALDPEILFFDEPSAGLDPVSSGRLDELILELRDSLGTTIVVVTHEVASIFAIGDRCIYLDSESKTITADGSPEDLAKGHPNSAVWRFLHRQSTLPERASA